MKADEALYVAKQQGRNCVRVATLAEHNGPSGKTGGQIISESIQEDTTNATSSKNSSEIEPTSIA
jgi:hypothetical protein